MADEGFDFEIAVEPSVGLRRLRGAILALGVTGLALSAWLARSHDNKWLLLALGFIMLGAGWRHARIGLARGRLSVNSRGSASWYGDPAGTVLLPGGSASVEVRVERWFAGERLAWLRLRDSGGRRYEILVGRGSIDENRWRRLSAWLTWLRRGAAA
jgi:hypothetical protein